MQIFYFWLYQILMQTIIKEHKYLQVAEGIEQMIHAEVLRIGDKLPSVRVLSEEWRIDYNTERPHKSLGYLSPVKYAEQKNSEAALSTPASEKLNQIEAQPVVDKAVEQKKSKFENSNWSWH